MINRMMTAVYVSDLARSQAFYQDLLGLKAVFTTDWIVQLADPDSGEVCLMLQPQQHELVPTSFQKNPQGLSLVFVVDDVDKRYRYARSQNWPIVQEPRNEEYGQRRFLLADLDGVLIDICTPCEPSAEFIAQYF
ncbi:hypothetical protein CHH28_15885 [Bacterioplanes sanyensis]|uniref:VOC domain-containing protein n=1 Tax=Bacterioplanes sanyensis TaxID=1249553 RepID=A0A222FPB0_9GAMM|nr:VOC family protein [Bacterioplanes sanyensis]ASP40063.1 hypothetical protein CHH28_15885 [Bacterioplanes sanyensis]